MKLTKAEYKVAELVTKGLSEKEIASELSVSPKTVHNQTYSIRKKWKARSAVDVARMFILKLDDPKKYFTALMFVGIQFHIMLNISSMELRKPTKTSVRTVRNGKRRSDEYQFC